MKTKLSINIALKENTSNKPIYIADGMVKLGSNARVIRSSFSGPGSVGRGAQVGPDATVGKYFGLNENSFLARATVGAYCVFGARTAINPFNHPTNWLSIHEFQYHPEAFSWIDEYARFSRLERSSDMFQQVNIGNDVWSGHNVIILPGVKVGDGAVIGAGSVVTKNIPSYAIVVGSPAKIKRYRFSETIIERLLRVKWWELELTDLSGLPFSEIDRCVDLLEEMRAVKSS